MRLLRAVSAMQNSTPKVRVKLYFRYLAVSMFDKPEAFIEALSGTQILETGRSGVSGISRSKTDLKFLIRFLY